MSERGARAALQRRGARIARTDGAKQIDQFIAGVAAEIDDRERERRSEERSAGGRLRGLAESNPISFHSTLRGDGVSKEGNCREIPFLLLPRICV